MSELREKCRKYIFGDLIAPDELLTPKYKEELDDLEKFAREIRDDALERAAKRVGCYPFGSCGNCISNNAKSILALKGGGK